MNTLFKFFKDESGATAIEYGLIAALIAVGIRHSVTFRPRWLVLTLLNWIVTSRHLKARAASKEAAFVFCETF